MRSLRRRFRAGSATAQRIAASLAEIDDPAEAVSTFVANIAGYVEASSFRSGGPLMTIAMETAATNERLNLGLPHRLSAVSRRVRGEADSQRF